MKQQIVAAAVSLLFFLGCGQATAGVVADSYNDFSGTQGTNGWYYGYYSGNLTASTFTLFPVYDPDYFDDIINGAYIAYGYTPFSEIGGYGGYYISTDYWTSLFPLGGCGNQAVPDWGKQGAEQYAVRRWVSDVAGTVTISGLMDSDTGGCMTVAIDVDGNQVFSEQTVPEQTSYSFSTDVSVGSDVDFIVTVHGVKN
jgi:hypothetical protein